MIFGLADSVRGSIRVGNSSALAGLEQSGITEGQGLQSLFLAWGSCFLSIRGALVRKSRVRSSCCPRSWWVLAQELLLCDRYLTNPAASQIPPCFHGLFAFKLYFTFPPSFYFFFIPSPKAKSREPWGNCLFHGWQADLQMLAAAALWL